MWVCIFFVRTWRIFWYQNYLGLLKLLFFAFSVPPFSVGVRLQIAYKVLNEKKIYFFLVNTKYISQNN